MTEHSRRFAMRLLVSTVLVTARFIATPVDAQILYGSIVGTVTDAQGGYVPGASTGGTMGPALSMARGIGRDV